MSEQLEMLERNARIRDFESDDIKREEQEERLKKNKGFTQVYGKGFKRLQHLMKNNPSAARLYIILAEHMDGHGAVVASQEVLGEYLEMSKRTIIRLTKTLEAENAIFRIRVGNGVYCYALDPEEVWKAWNTGKDTAVFNTKTLVSKKDKENQTVNKRLAMMFKERNQIN